MLQPARQSLSCCSRASSPGAPRQPRGKPWPRARSLVGRLRHGWGKPLAGWGEWERDMGISDPAAVHGDSTPVEELPGEPPGSCWSQAGDGGGGALPWGSQVLWQGLGAPWPWARPSLGAALAATRTRLCWRWPKAVGGQRGCMAPCWGFWQSPLPPPPSQGHDPCGAGGARGGSGCQLGSMPATKAAQRAQRNEVALVQVPTAALVQKIHPELVAVATAMGWVPRRGGGHDPGPRCAGTGPRRRVVGAPWGGGAGCWQGPKAPAPPPAAPTRL